MREELSALMARALVEKSNPGDMCPPPTPPKTLEEAEIRSDYLSYVRAHDEELERHGPNGLRMYDFVDALPTDRFIP